jgi:hypothetical protein
MFSFCVTLEMLFKVELWLAVLLDDGLYWAEESHSVSCPLLHVWINDQETQPDETLPKDPIASHRRHEAAARCVSIPAIRRLLGTEGPVDLCEGMTPNTTRVSELLAAEEYDIDPFWP